MTLCPRHQGSLQCGFQGILYVDFGISIDENEWRLGSIRNGSPNHDFLWITGTFLYSSFLVYLFKGCAKHTIILPVEGRLHREEFFIGENNVAVARQPERFNELIGEYESQPFYEKRTLMTVFLNGDRGEPD